MTPLQLVLWIFAFVFFLLAAIVWHPAVYPHNWRLVAAGLACAAATHFVGTVFH